MFAFVRKNKILLTICMAFVVFFRRVYMFCPKLWCGLFAISSLLLTSSFCFAPEKQEEESLSFSSEYGDVAVEEMDMASLSAGEEDIKRLLQETEKGAAQSVDPGKVEEGTLIYDEDSKSSIKPTFEEDWSLILVNKEHLIPEDYEVELGTIRGNIKCDTRIVSNVLDMIQAARDDGVILSICSPYRDNERQVMLFNRKKRSYIAKGYSDEEAEKKASETVALPGTSEHELGLAFDFISNDYTTLDAGFARTDAGRWLKANAAEYGFILRYPSDKTDITDIEFEPWHYRYVGRAAAKEIMEKGLCLEEYVSLIGVLEEE